MATITLTPEQFQVVELAGGQSVRVEDPTGRRTYLLVEEIASGSGTAHDEPRPSWMIDLPEGVRRAQAAFLRDIPGLLKDESLRGQWVGYSGDERIGIAASEELLASQCAARGLKPDQYATFLIEETEEVDYPSSWM